MFFCANVGELSQKDNSDYRKHHQGQLKNKLQKTDMVGGVT